MSNTFKQSNSTDLIESFYPEHRLIHFSIEDKEKARPNSGDYSYERATRDAWLNRIVSNLFQDFLVSFLQEIGSTEKVEIWQEKNLPAIWEFVNGTALTLGDKRIVIIPKDNWNTKDFIVPAEWIKISEWRGDYYVAIQVNLDEMWIRIWGYTTYEQIQAGRYDSRMRNYRLTSDELNSDIYEMLEARLEESVVSRDKVSLSVLNPAEASTMMKESENPSSFSPRYKFDINQWCAFIADRKRRNKLYQKRLNIFTTSFSDVFKRTTEVFEKEWVDIDDILESLDNIIVPSFKTRLLGGLGTNIESSKFTGEKKFNLQLIGDKEQEFALLIQKKKVEINEIQVICHLFPLMDSQYRNIPKDLKMSIIEESGCVHHEIIPEPNSLMLRYVFYVSENENFGIKIACQNQEQTNFFINK